MYSNHKKTIIANWKMNFTLQEAEDFCNKFNEFPYKDHVIIGAPLPYLSYLSFKFPEIKFLAQSISSIDGFYGAFTGEVSARIVKSININHALCGHSERRKYFNEDDSIAFKMATNAINCDVIPIICIGEEHKLSNMDKKNFLFNQINNSIPKTPKPIIVAYEPIWAVGTGITPTPDEVEETVAEIKHEISKVAKNSSIVYGGSINVENSTLFRDIDSLDGILVGGSSLNFVEFMKIVKAYA